MHRGILLVAGGLALFAAGVIFSSSRDAFGLVPVTPYEADVNKSGGVNSIDLQQVAMKFGQPVPTATPDLSRDIVLTNGVSGSRGDTLWFGAYRTSECPEAVFFVHATSSVSTGVPTFDLYVSASTDGITPAGAQNIGNSSTMGYVGTWHTHRRVSRNESGALQGGGNIEPYTYGDDLAPQYPFLMVGGYLNEAGTFRAEVHCSRGS